MRSSSASVVAQLLALVSEQTWGDPGSCSGRTKLDSSSLVPPSGSSSVTI
jgi:hypothetical protein